MNYCEIKNNPKSQTLHKMSGLSEFDSYSSIESYYNKYGRFPELDEIPYANSEAYLKDKLQIKTTKGNTNFTTFEKIKEQTSAQTVEESNVILNQEYSDLETHLIPIEDSVIVEIEHRPSEYTDIDLEEKEIDFDPKDNQQLIQNALNRLAQYYGVQIIPITKYEISQIPELDSMSVSEVHGFIYNGNIYINTDVASIDTPIHEQLHLFLGSVRYNNPNLYFSLVSSVQNLPTFQERLLEYPNRALSDASEEIFVEELAKYLTNQPSLFSQLDPSAINTLLYNIKRDIDSILMGKQSVKSISNIFNHSLLDLAKILNSDNFDMEYAGTLDKAAIHRIMANTKEELMNKNELIQTCV